MAASRKNKPTKKTNKRSRGASDISASPSAAEIAHIKIREEKYRKAVESMNDGFVIQNARGEISEFNPAALEILGLTENQLLGRTSMDPKWNAMRQDKQPFPGDQHPAIVALKTGNKVMGTLMGLNLPTGVTRWIRINSTPFSGQPITGAGIEGVPLDRWVMTTFADVTGVITAQSQLAEFFEASLDLIVIANTDGSLKKVNPTFIRTLGYSEEEILTRGFMHFIHPDDVEPTLNLVKTLAQGERLVKFENRYVTKTGDYRVISWNCYPNTETGDLYATGRDVTTLRETEHGFRQLMTALNDAAIVGFTDANGTITEVNDNFCRVSGYSREELIGSDHRLVNSNTHPDTFFQDLWKTIGSGKAWTGDIKNRAKDGSHYWVRTFIAPLFDSNREISKYVAIRFDVTAQKVTERENLKLRDELGASLAISRESERSFREIFNNVPVGIVKIDANLRFIAVNPAYANMLGYSIPELMNMTAIDVTHPDDIAASRNAIPTAEKSDRGLATFEKRYIHKSGRIIWARVTAYRLAPDSSGISKSLSVVEDITAAKAIERELIDARDQAIASGQAKSQFLANMSHEIRTPLNGILGNLELLNGENLNEEARKSAHDALDSGRVLMGLLNDILNLSKINAGQLVLDPAPFELRDVFRGVEQIYGTGFREKGIHLNISMDPALPCWIVGDSLRLRQIINNLTSNALKFTSKGIVTIHAAKEDHDFVKITIADSGIGISEENIRKLFTPFTQADSGTTRRFGGTGLGLSISRELARLMGGDVTLTSQEGVGTKFTVRIPFPSCEAPIESAPTETDIENKEIPSLHILVAEDNPVNQALTRRVLEKLGHRVVIAENGEIAMRFLGDTPFDVILMDCQMPVMDGYEATKRIIERMGPSRPRIVALTANAFKEDQERCLAAGMDYYLSKPVARAQLESILYKIVSEQRKSA